MSANFSILTSQQQLQDQDPHYSMNSRHTFQSPDFPVNMMMYLNLPSTAVHEPEQLFSVSGRDFVDGSTSGQRKEEMLFFAPSFSDNNDNNITTLDTQVYTKDLLHEQNCRDDLNLYHEGFSLSLGNQVLMSSNNDEINDSCENRYMNSGISSMLDDQSAASNGGFNAGSMCNQKSDQNLKKEEMVVGDRRMYSPNYITAVQQLLDEFVNVGQCLNPKKKQYYQSVVPFNRQNSSIVSPSGELSPSQNDLCNKMTKLLSLLDEVDRKYNKYCRQMQSVVSSFENMVGLGAARSYTTLAHQTISRQFRHLVDAIKRQIQVVQQSLGEKGTIITNVEGARLSRLRYVDQQVRQERAFQQFGMVRQPWRPQRGLPETAVSVLRAWLFEHFLHPYPKDSEKIMLARKAGLTRSQVANWFINARVRLWKPMIEEMYKEEVSNIGVDYYYDSSESPKAAKKLKLEPEDNGQVVLHDSLTSIVSNNGHLGMIPCESRNNIDSDLIEANDFAVKYSFGSSISNHQEDEKMAFELNTSWHNEIVHIADQSNITTDNNQSMNSTTVVDNYNHSVLGGTVRGDHVSLALGLHYSLGDTLPVFDTSADSASMMVKADYFCMDPINQQERFYNPNMLSHFVV